MNGNIRVGNLFGIPFYVNPSWFLILGLVTLTYGQELMGLPGINGFTAMILGLLTAILLFSSVLAHELGHSFVAQSQGIEVKSITLFLFGGLANLDRESKTPLEAFLVAIAGPLVSLLLFGFFTLILSNFALLASLRAIFSLLASINLVLGLFNLIPGLPLDGGNILKALVWKITGNPNKGIIFASRVGQIFGWLAILVGIGGTLGLLPIGSFWTLLIGWFLLQNAGFSAQTATVQETLSQYKAIEAVIPDSPIVSANLNLREFVNDYIIGKDKWQKFLVVDEEGKLLGTIAVEELKKIPTSLWTTTLVKELIQPTDTNTTITPEQSLFEVAKLIEEKHLSLLTVVQEDGRVIGLVDKESVINLLQKQVQTKSV